MSRKRTKSTEDERNKRDTSLPHCHGPRRSSSSKEDYQALQFPRRARSRGQYRKGEGARTDNTAPAPRTLHWIAFTLCSPPPANQLCRSRPPTSYLRSASVQVEFRSSGVGAGIATGTPPSNTNRVSDSPWRRGGGSVQALHREEQVAENLSRYCVNSLCSLVDPVPEGAFVHNLRRSVPQKKKRKKGEEYLSFDTYRIF